MTDDELISAYLDGQLSEAERDTFEARIRRDATLRQQVMVTRLLLDEARALPSVAVPRNFILPRDAGRTPMPRASKIFPWLLRLGSVAATALFVAAVVLDVSRPPVPMAAPAAAPMMEVADAQQAAVEAVTTVEAAAKVEPMATAAPEQPMAQARSQALPAEAGQDGALSADGAASAAAESVSPALPVEPPPVEPAPIVTPLRITAALALLVAVALGVLGWRRR